MDETHGISVEDKQGEFFHDMTPLFCWDLAYHWCHGSSCDGEIDLQPSL
jgi:hypothetical protein